MEVVMLIIMVITTLLLLPPTYGKVETTCTILTVYTGFICLYIASASVNFCNEYFNNAFVASLLQHLTLATTTICMS